MQNYLHLSFFLLSPSSAFSGPSPTFTSQSSRGSGPCCPPQVTECCLGLNGPAWLASWLPLRESSYHQHAVASSLTSSPLRAALQTSRRARYSQSDTERELFRPSLRLATSVTNGTANSKLQSSISLRRQKGGWASWSQKETGHCRMVEEKYFLFQCL